ncbi:MAG: CCA tRNA nucleotidyltransferase [Candidatus Bathyarchaeia archaeon]
MEGLGEWNELRDEILRRITPSCEEEESLGRLCSRLERDITRLLEEAGIEGVAEVHGSAARGTWLAGEKDIDLFLILDPKYDRTIFQKALDVVKMYLGSGWVEAYAEHPYIKSVIDGFDVEFVPCYKVEPGKRLYSATDRTPLHTRFVNENLSPERRGDVRLLKQFMKGIGVYGAEVKVGGFSGYLCELLIICLGSFEEVLLRASNWKRGESIDITGKWREDDLRRVFKNPIIVVDPVDPSRNVASAVSDTSAWTFVAAARSFLEKPREIFFFHEEETNPASLLEDLRCRDPPILCILIPDESPPVPDILWGQLYKAEKALSGLLERRGFKILRSSPWSDEVSRHIMVFEVESVEIPSTMKFMGPPVEMVEDSERFLRAHLKADSTITGPWIEDARWWVGMKRKYKDARKLLNEALSRDGRGIGIPRILNERIKKGFKILLNDEIKDLLEGDFIRFMVDFIRGRPVWLE